jgi:hypothetical protein
MIDDQKLPPYQRLKMLVNDEPTLTDKASKNLDEILGVQNKPTVWDKIKELFNKIDSFIFAKRSKITNIYTKR